MVSINVSDGGSSAMVIFHVVSFMITFLMMYNCLSKTDFKDFSIVVLSGYALFYTLFLLFA